jgi:hypothetical protein
MKRHTVLILHPSRIQGQLARLPTTHLNTILQSLQHHQRNYAGRVLGPLKFEEVNQQSIVIRTSAKPFTLEDGCPLYTHKMEPIHRPVPEDLLKPKVELTEEQIETIRKLRETDPDTWTQKKLAVQFGVPNTTIAKFAPISEEWLAKRNHDKEIERLKDIFERGVNPYRRKKKTGTHLPDSMRENKEKFAKAVQKAGGLKNFMRNNNIIRKRLRGGKPGQILEIDTAASKVVHGEPFEPPEADLQKGMNAILVEHDLIRRERAAKRAAELEKLKKSD